MMLRYIFKILSLRATTFFKKKFIFKILIKDIRFLFIHFLFRMYPLLGC